MEDNIKQNRNTDEILDSFYNEIVSGDSTESIEEYRHHIEMVQTEFIEKTRIQGADIPFLFVSIFLQCLRICVINKVTQIEKANINGGREEKLHQVQDKIFEKFKRDAIDEVKPLYASLDSIISTRGVPYDATRPEDEVIKALKLFKGGNHRFATLGHDPIAGLVFGTSNILTNTITMVEKGRSNPVPTYRVIYDSFLKYPQISIEAGTLAMLKAAEERCKNDRISVAAAVIKQLIHIATDIYTPCGIQLPGANLVLDHTHAEKLTKHISTGDVLKVGASAGASVLINTLISAVHGCKLLFENTGEPYDEKLYQARTRKVLMYSNAIASSSNILTSVMKGMNNLDVGGMIVTLYRIVNDSKFICSLEEEFINSEVSKIYSERESRLFENG